MGDEAQWLSEILESMTVQRQHGKLTERNYYARKKGDRRRSDDEAKRASGWYHTRCGLSSPAARYFLGREKAKGDSGSMAAIANIYEGMQVGMLQANLVTTRDPRRTPPQLGSASLTASVLRFGKRGQTPLTPAPQTAEGTGAAWKAGPGTGYPSPHALQTQALTKVPPGQIPFRTQPGHRKQHQNMRPDHSREQPPAFQTLISHHLYQQQQQQNLQNKHQQPEQQQQQRERQQQQQQRQQHHHHHKQ